MPKKIMFVLMLGVLLVSACTPQTTPTADLSTEMPTEVSTQAALTDVDYSGPMPCTTVYDYELSDEAAGYQAVVDQLPAVSEDDWMRGNPDAPITIIEYADFQCSACANYSYYLRALLEAFPDSIRVVFRDMPLASIHDKAYLSSMVGKAAGNQGAFWDMYDILFENQSVWFYYTDDEFMDWASQQAEALGLDMDQFNADVNDTEVLNALQDRTNELLTLGLHYTPFVIINDHIYKDSNPDLFALVGIYEYDGYAECPSWVIDPAKSYTAVLDTSAGEIKIDLYADVAPLAVNNFVFLAQNGWYDDVYFHRVLQDFVAQAGDPSGYGVISPGYKFANETEGNLSFDKVGVVGMANAGADQNGSQFFITLGPATDLDGSYTIFGQVQDDSLSVLDQIALRDPDTAIDFTGATVINSIEIIEN